MPKANRRDCRTGNRGQKTNGLQARDRQRKQIQQVRKDAGIKKRDEKRDIPLEKKQPQPNVRLTNDRRDVKFQTGVRTAHQAAAEAAAPPADPTAPPPVSSAAAAAADLLRTQLSSEPASLRSAVASASAASGSGATQSKT
jgi:hypothetical protein